MILFENQFLTVSFDETNHIVRGAWHNTQDLNFNDEVFRTSMLAWFEEVKKIKFVNVLADARQFLFAIAPNTQIWINDNIIGHYPQYGVKKLGFLVSPDIFAQVSIEQTIDEKAQEFIVSYFEDEAKVIEWLSQK